MVALGRAGRGRGAPPRHALDEFVDAPTATPRHAAERERKRVERGSTLAVMVVLVLTSGFVAGTTASFTAGTTNDNAVATSVLFSPSSGTATLKGDQITLTWGLMGGGVDDDDVGYRIRHSDGGQAGTEGQSPGCPAATNVAWASATKVAHRTVGPYSHDGVGSAGTRANTIGNYAEGRWVCYKIETVAPCCGADSMTDPGDNAWTALSDTSPVHDIQVGHVIQGIAVESNASNPPNNNNIGVNDKITIVFSQPVDAEGANAPQDTDRICVRTDFDTIWLGVPNTKLCNSFDSTAPNNVTTDMLTNLPLVRIGAMDVNAVGGNGQFEITNAWATSNGAFDNSPPYSCTPNCTRLQITIDSGTNVGDPSSHVKFYPSRMTDALRSQYNTAGQSLTENSGGTRYQICTPNAANLTDVSGGRCYPNATGQTNW